MDPMTQALQAELMPVLRKVAAFEHVMQQADSRRPRTGQDASGAVTVEVDGSGRTTAIELAQGWEHRVADLAAAIVEAARGVQVAGMTEFLEKIAALPDDLGDVAVPEGYVERRLAEATPRLDPESVGPGDARTVVDQIDRAIADSRTQLARAAAGAPASEEAPSSEPIRFTLTPTGTIQGCTIDAQWLRLTPKQAVGERLMEQLRAQLDQQGTGERR